MTRIGDTVELVDEMAQLNMELPVQPFFDFTHAALYAFDTSLSQVSLLWQGDGYAYARLTETAHGSALFSRVDSNEMLFEALKSGTLTAENIVDLLPTADVLRLSSDASTPEVWLEDARQFSFASSSARLLAKQEMNRKNQ